jgi:serine/threonine protein kinase
VATAGNPEVSVLTGRRLEVYQLQERIGAGGMGEVYRATDTKLNRPSRSSFSPRLWRDVRPVGASSAKRNSHPRSIIPTSSRSMTAGELDGRQYLVTELVDGGTLRGLDERRVHGRWQDVVEMMIGPAGWSGYLRTRRASCIVTSSREHPDHKDRAYGKLADFGLAKLRERPRSSANAVTETRTMTGVHRRHHRRTCRPSRRLAVGSTREATCSRLAIVLYELLAAQSPVRPEPTDLDDPSSGSRHRSRRIRLPASIPSPLRELY